MADPIDTWRTSFQSGPMTFAVPGTVLGTSVGGGPVHLVASGDAVLGSQPIAVDDAFHIGSMTKLFTAALIMQLDQEGALSLENTIDTWFDAAPNGSKITVLMLLEHESGLFELDFDLVGTTTNQQLVDNVFAQQPIAAPGAEYQYLNAGYIVLGRIAEEATGKTYDDLIQTRFIEPLDLNSTYLDGMPKAPRRSKVTTSRAPQRPTATASASRQRPEQSTPPPNGRAPGPPGEWSAPQGIRLSGSAPWWPATSSTTPTNG